MSQKFPQRMLELLQQMAEVKPIDPARFIPEYR